MAYLKSTLTKSVCEISPCAIKRGIFERKMLTKSRMIKYAGVY